MNLNNDDFNFDDFFKLSDRDELRHKASIIMFKFLSEVEKHTSLKYGIKTKLAELTGLSKSYITQLFNGDKFVNMLTLAKFEKALEIEFEIQARPTRATDFTTSIKTSDQPQKSIEVIIYNCKDDISPYHNQIRLAQLKTVNKNMS